MSCRTQKMELVFELGSLDVADVAKRMISIFDLGHESIKLYGKPVSSLDIPRLIKSAKRHAFNIETSKGSVPFRDSDSVQTASTRDT